MPRRLCLEPRSYQAGSDTGFPYPIKARSREQLRYEDLTNLLQTPAVAEEKQPGQALPLSDTTPQPSPIEKREAPRIGFLDHAVT